MRKITEERSNTFLWLHQTCVEVQLPLNSYTSLNFLIAQESTFKQGGPLSHSPDPEERIDCQRALCRRGAQEAAAILVSHEILPDVTCVGYPYQSEIVKEVARLKKVEWFVLQDQELEGSFRTNDRVCLVLPEVNAETSFPYLDVCRNKGLVVVQVLVILDRQQGGFDALVQATGPDVRVSALMTRAELRDAWLFYMT